MVSILRNNYVEVSLNAGNGVLTIPKPIRDIMGLKKGDSLALFLTKETNGLVLLPLSEVNRKDEIRQSLPVIQE